LCREKAELKKVVAATEDVITALATQFALNPDGVSQRRLNIESVTVVGDVKPFVHRW
jgi:hypothetical protein